MNDTTDINPVGPAPGWPQDRSPYCTRCVNGVQEDCDPCAERQRLIRNREEARYRHTPNSYRYRAMTSSDLHEAWRVEPAYSEYVRELREWRDTKEFKARMCG